MLYHLVFKFGTHKSKISLKLYFFDGIIKTIVLPMSKLQSPNSYGLYSFVSAGWASFDLFRFSKKKLLCLCFLNILVKDKKKALFKVLQITVGYFWRSLSIYTHTHTYIWASFVLFRSSKKKLLCPCFLNILVKDQRMLYSKFFKLL